MPNVSRFGQPSLPALVFIHGFLGNKTDWLKLMPQLSQFFHCICLDLPGHGDNLNHTLPTPGFDACVDDIIATLDALSVKQFHLLGYSLGGRIALHLAQRVPDRLLSLTLESCHPGLHSIAEKLARAQNDAQWAERLNQSSFIDFLGAWYQQAVFANLNNEQRSALVSKRLRNNPQKLHNCYLATSLSEQDDLWKVPDQLACPSYFFAGSQDKKFSQLAHQWQSTSAISVQPFANLGHNLHLAAPAAFCRTLIRLLSVNAPKTDSY